MYRIVLSIFLFLLIASTNVNADNKLETTIVYDFFNDSNLGEMSSPSIEPFSKGSCTFQLYSSTSQFGESGDIHLGHFGVGYFIEDNASINLEFIGGKVNGENSGSIITSDGDMYGVELFLRKHLYKNGKVSFFAEIGAGFIHSENPFPGHGTHSNFSPQIGVGMHYDIGSNWYLSGGARWHHISNASRTKNNPGYDGALFWLGITKSW